MACFHPLEAWQTDSGEIIFSERGKIRRPLNLPCGKCIGCRITKARAWTYRIVHESQMHKANAFITLTYDSDDILSLNYDHFQKFIRALRKDSDTKLRFYAAGEYGEINLRPHWHAIIFGRTFTNDGPVAKDVYRSRTLEKHWTHGYSSWGLVTPESAGYVARYAIKKVTGERAFAHYQRLNTKTGELVEVSPELSRMSLKPGIGYTWFQKYWREIYEARDGIVQPGGNIVPPPRYYDKLLEVQDHEMKDEKDLQRYLRSAQFAQDCTPQRLAVREKCAIAKNRFLQKRHL